MAIKIGELLIQNGIITEKQLDEALGAQQIFGGRLGTNLVELGFVSETELAQLLAKQMNISSAQASEFDQIPEEALASISAEVAAKHKVIPLAISGRRVTLAMADPTNLAAVDEISFSSGMTIAPKVAPEILITYGLEKYYGISRETRYLKVSGASDLDFNIVQTSAQAGPRANDSSPVQVEDRSNFLDVKRHDFKASEYNYQQAHTDLSNVHEQKDVFEIVTKVIGQNFKTLVLFVVRGELAAGWSQTGASIANSDLRKISFKIKDSGIMNLACQHNRPVSRVSPDNKVDAWLYQNLGAPVNNGVMCLPVLVNKQPIGLLLAFDLKEGELSDLLENYDNFAKKISMALQIVFLRKRIVS